MQARALLINNIIEIAYMKVKIQENFLLITKSQCTMFSHRFYTQWQILQSKWKSFKDWKVKKCTENHEITNYSFRNANDRAVEKKNSPIELTVKNIKFISSTRTPDEP